MPLRGQWATSEDILVTTAKEEDVIGIYGLEARDTIKYPVLQKTPLGRCDPDLTANRVELRKPSESLTLNSDPLNLVPVTPPSELIFLKLAIPTNSLLFNVASTHFSLFWIF